MTNQSVLIVAKSHLIGEVLVEMVKKAVSSEVICVDAEDKALNYLNTLKPALIIISHPDITIAKVEQYIQSNPAKLVMLGFENEMMLIYSRSNYSKATLKNFIKVIKESKVRA